MKQMKRDAGKASSQSESESSRRDFLAQASCAIFAAMAASGIAAADALSFPIDTVSADTPQGAERTYPLPSTDGASVDQSSEVILVRFNSRIYAFALACPHENTALRWRPQDHRFQCPRHQAKFQPDGTWMGSRKTRDMDRFALRLEGQKIAVDLSRLYRSDQQKSEWEAAFVSL